jgi:hypothetical protein
MGRSRRRLLGAVAGIPVFAVLTAIGQDEADARRKGRGRKRSHRPGRKKNNRKGKRKGAATCHVCPDGCAFSSVQAAHDAAQDGDKIILCEGTYTEAVTIHKNVSLAARKGDNVVLRGTGSGSVVTVQPNVTTTISGGPTITGGTGTLVDGVLRGGGIFTYGNLTVTGSVLITENSAGQGGGIFNGGTLTLSGANTIVHDNTATADGAGIYNERTASVTIDAALIHKNAATGNGGGVYNSGDQTSLVIRNNAQVALNTANQGAGMYTTSVDGPELPNVSIADSSITQNVASTVGGGIFNVGCPISLTSSTVFENTATIAGGIFNTEGGVITLDTESAVVDNHPDDCVGTDACDG